MVLLDLGASDSIAKALTARGCDVITVPEKFRDSQRYKDIFEVTAGRLVPEWIEADAENFTITVKQLPTRAMIDVPVNEMLIVELYSK